MNDTSTNPTSKRWTIILIGVFMLMLWLPTLDTFFHIDRTLARSENRNMATFPQFPSDKSGLPAYIAGLEVYFNDHFGFRKLLVRKNNRVAMVVLQGKKCQRARRQGRLVVLHGG
ncbi:MAG: hypothetical protein WDN00_12020 [Limisphaerales bacterium]